MCQCGERLGGGDWPRACDRCHARYRLEDERMVEMTEIA
jgi:hypothetical protein